MKKSHDKLATRLSLILTKLNNGEKFNTKSLSKEFGVSIRTIQRDINERFSYIPIEKNGDDYSLASHALGKLNFKDIKSFATLCGIKSLYPELTDGFIADILNEKLNKAYLIKNHSFEDISYKQNEFEKISAAIVKNSPISFEFNKIIRVVNPYKLINNDGVWYLLAEEDKKLKTFTFSKIKNFKWEDENKSFKPNKKFLEELEKNESNWFTDKIEVILQIDNEAKEYFERRKVFSNQNILEQNDDYLIISTKVSYDDEILKVVKYWIPYIRIVEPLYLKDKLNNVLKDYLA